jgi:transcriptional regulator with XRE-family HTH domain
MENDLMLSVKEIRKKNTLSLLEFFERKDFSLFTGIEYTLLNQYLSANAPKNIGNNNAKKITDALNLPEGWLDHEHSQAEIFRVAYNSGRATKNVAEHLKNTNLVADTSSVTTENGYRILNIKNVIKIQRGQELDISELPTAKSSIFVPPTVESPIAFEVAGSGYPKPYKVGFIFLCDAKKIIESGDDAIFITTEGEIILGEFLFERDENIFDIESLDGDRRSLDKRSIKNILPIVAFYPSSQKQTIN